MNVTSFSHPDVRALDDDAFRAVQNFVAVHTGTALGESKRQTAAAALAPRLAARTLADFGSYVRLLATEPAERDLAIDLLTTHETAFFREPNQLETLTRLARAHAAGPESARPFRVWSAACATGEEVWSIAMTLAGALGERDWHVLGTDISRRCIDEARRASYPRARLNAVPPNLQQRYVVPDGDRATIHPSLRDRTRFEARNLLDEPPGGGCMDVVFLRNVLIYFEPANRLRALERIRRALRPGGRLIIGRSESLATIEHGLIDEHDSIYRLAAAR